MHRLLPLVLLLLAGSARAQVSDPCTYAACALSVEMGVWGFDVYAGEQHQRVARLGAFDRLSDVVAEVPEAAASAERHDVLYRRGLVAASLGGALLGASMVSALPVGADARLGMRLASIPVLAYSIPLSLRAREHRRAAVWQFNRALAERD
jgi:hypothetical protein